MLVNIYLCTMREDIFEYIKILLPKHKCVTIPTFGAFILNKEVERPYVNGVSMPACTVVFNSRLQHDDGVLSSYIQSVYNISYEKASKELANAVKEIRTALLLKKEVDCGTLGKIELIESSIIFTPSDQYVFPQHYGLAPVGLSTLSTINRNITKEVKVVSLKKKFAIAASSAAVLLLLILPSTSITDSATDHQQAGFLTSLTTSEAQAPNHKPSAPTLAPIVDIEVPQQAEVSQVVQPQAELEVPAIQTAPVATNRSARTYYLIVGGEPTASQAERALQDFRAEGFSNAQLVTSPERYRIYVASFDNKKDAESYLDQFRRDNPKYQSAWIHSKRN